jgi:hypothetical protein
MSHTSNSITNKKQKHPKVGFQQYLYNSGEPKDDFSQVTPAEIAAELRTRRFFMKRRIRRDAQKLRDLYS